MEFANNINEYYDRVKNRWCEDRNDQDVFADFHKKSLYVANGETNSNIVMQLRNTVSLGINREIVFVHGRKIISVANAQKALDKLNSISKPIIRMELQTRLSYSPEEFYRAIST